LADRNSKGVDAGQQVERQSNGGSERCKRAHIGSTVEREGKERRRTRSEGEEKGDDEEKENGPSDNQTAPVLKLG
jgi:hypothetical protein